MDGTIQWKINLRLVCLGLLSVILLLLDIGMGIHYSRVSDGHLPTYSNITHISSELTTQRSMYEDAVWTRGEIRRRVASETTEEVHRKQMIERQRNRTKTYRDRITFLQQGKIKLQSDLNLSEESCRHCATGWTLLHSRCYYFATSNTITPKPWDAARDSCVKDGGNLAVIDSIAKQMLLSIATYNMQHLAGERLGFWLGLRLHQGGTWRWHGGGRGAPLLTGYWMPGEPKEQHLEMCAATYSENASLQTWYNVRCEHPNKWILSISVGSHGGKSSRAAVLCLVVLGVVLFAVDVSLGVYYSQLTTSIPQSGAELNKLFETYRNTLQNRDKAIKKLTNERQQLTLIQWELEHQKRRGKDYGTQLDTVQKEKTAAQAQVTLMRSDLYDVTPYMVYILQYDIIFIIHYISLVDCGHCLPGWIHIESKCFYLAEPNLGRKTWQDARNVCERKGADLAIIDSSVIQSSLNMHIQDRSNPSEARHHTGYWFGLRDVEVEGVWKWLNGETLVGGYWNEGEPNDVGNEDCAAIYPGINPFITWNDAPCMYSLKWICEMKSSDQ
ncbi:CD209 antigen [Merluccius polli]|uniref:CD209 antigen n=1 Tax=Merluccius polli TaxID=89951 RepID=A0AA47NNC3_MERPO|nr:CD209 antigen [Merluccius polli]